MASPITTPTQLFNGLDDESYTDAKFVHEINKKMQVPKRIMATGEFSDEDLLLSNQNGLINSWNYHEKINMNVPERILVMGNDQYLETRSAPREIQLENSILSKNQILEYVLVQSPSCNQTLSDLYPPTASEDNSSNRGTCPPSNLHANASEAVIGFSANNEKNNTNSIKSDSQLKTGGASKKSQHMMLYNDNSIVSQRDGTKIGVQTPHEDILYLRRQLAKLNRRVHINEINNEQLLQREKFVYCVGLAYFVVKAILWLNRK